MEVSKLKSTLSTAATKYCYENYDRIYMEDISFFEFLKKVEERNSAFRSVSQIRFLQDCREYGDDSTIEESYNKQIYFFIEDPKKNSDLYLRICRWEPGLYSLANGKIHLFFGPKEDFLEFIEKFDFNIFFKTPVEEREKKFGIDERSEFMKYVKVISSPRAK